VALTERRPVVAKVRERVSVTKRAKQKVWRSYYLVFHLL
jgi:hypothetical protein